MVRPTSVCHVNPVAATETFGDRSLVLHCENLRLTELNATARNIMGRLDGKVTLYHVAGQVAEDYHHPLGKVLSDVVTVIERMMALAIVQCED